MKGKIGEKNASSTSTKISLCPQATRHRPQLILIPTSAQTNQPLFLHIVDFYAPTTTQNRCKDLKRIMAPSTLTRKRLIRPLGNYLIQYRRLILRRSQNAPEPLNVLSNRSTPRQNDRHIRLGDIDALIQDFARYDDGEYTTIEPLQNLCPLLHWAQMRNRWDQKISAYLINRFVICRKNDRPIFAVHAQ